MLSLNLSRVKTRKLVSLSLSFLLYLCMLPIIPSAPARARSVVPKESVQSQDQGPQALAIPTPAPNSVYRQTNFISDIPGLAPVLDPLLVNPWGISATASSPFWIANNGTSTTQLVRGDVAGSPVVLNASPQTITIPNGLPTGTVANPTATDFVLPGACASAPCGANFLFASITGNITG